MKRLVSLVFVATACASPRALPPAVPPTPPLVYRFNVNNDCKIASPEAPRLLVDFVEREHAGRADILYREHGEVVIWRDAIGEERAYFFADTNELCWRIKRGEGGL